MGKKYNDHIDAIMENIFNRAKKISIAKGHDTDNGMFSTMRNVCDDIKHRVIKMHNNENNPLHSV